MRTEVEDNWFAVVDGFAASSLRMLFVGQTGLWMHFAVFGERLCDIMKKCKHPCLIRHWSMFSSHTAHNFVALYVFPGLHFIAACNYFIFYATKRFLSAVD